ncbi:hypothetical protein, partial [Streptomyces sp. IBSBF 2390]|uniref:hypothetical protein n=1 Tax=Streptomyces sp. IBSBF 2390 TaxID=2903533 RepID=UPI002FDC7344
MTETALHTIVRNLEDNINQQQPTLAAFIDIEGAFNNVNSEAIIDSLMKKNVDWGLCCWIKHMLTSRLVTGDIAGFSAVRAVSRG